MSDIQRWRDNWSFPGDTPNLRKNDEGEFVLYADHMEALRQATALATPETVAQAGYWYEQGQGDALDAAREAVLGAKAIDVAHGRGLDEPAQFVWLNNALSAIDALKEKQ